MEAMRDLGFLKALASGAIEAEAPMIHAAGVLRCLERQQGTELMLSSVISALADGARLVGQGPFMVEYLHFAAARLAEALSPPARQQTVAAPTNDAAGHGLDELIIPAVGADLPVLPKGQCVVDLAVFRNGGGRGR